MKLRFIFFSILLANSFFISAAFAESQSSNTEDEVLSQNPGEVPKLSEVKFPVANAEVLSQQPDIIPANTDEKKPKCPTGYELVNEDDKNKPETCRRKKDTANEKADIEITVTGTRTPRSVDGIGNNG